MEDWETIYPIGEKLWPEMSTIFTIGLENKKSLFFRYEIEDFLKRSNIEEKG